MKTYFNLSCGVEGLPALARMVNPPKNYGFIRIQSTALEQKRWAFVINELDYDFLLHLAIGEQVEVVDFSSRKSTPRSLFQGVPWITYVLNRYWYGIVPEKVLVKRHNVAYLFNRLYRLYEDDFEKKLSYFNKLKTDSPFGIQLEAANPLKYSLDSTGKALLDGGTNQHILYRKMILNHIQNQ